MINKLMRNSSLSSIRTKLKILYALNVSDIILTISLLKSNLYREANIIMKNVVTDTRLSIIFKVVLPLLLILYINSRIGDATEDQLHVANRYINLAIIFYMIINIMHVLGEIMIALLQRM